MKQTLARVLVVALLLFPSLSLAAPINVNGGGTGTTTVSNGAYLVGGSDPLRLSATTSPTAGIFTATSTTATSSLPRLSVSSAIDLLGEYITNLTTWVRAKIDAYLTGDQGITYSAGSLSFDCSEVEGTGIDCAGENITLDATGAWTGTFDGLEGAAYLARANHTGTQDASTITGGTFAAGSFIFPSGMTSLGSTTIGNGTQTGGLTVSGGATTTGNAYFNGDIKVGNGQTNNNILTFQTTNTSTNGINYLLQDGTTIRGYVRWDSNEDLTIRGDRVVIQTNSASDSTSLFLAETTGNVGIATSSPFAKLSVTGESGGTTHLFAISSSTSGFATSTAFVINSSGNVGISSPAPTHSLTLGNTSTGIALYNTVDQVTNYERVQMLWSGNIFVIDGRAGGSGGNRTIRLIVGQSSSSQFDFTTGTASTGAFSVNRSTGGANITQLSTNPTPTSSAGTNVSIGIFDNFTQSGTAGYTALSIKPTETSLGSGSKFLIQAGTSTATSLFTVSNTGITGIGTTTFPGILGVGTYGSTNGTSTISGGKLQWDGYNSAGSRVCTFIVGTTLTIVSGSCNI